MVYRCAQRVKLALGRTHSQSAIDRFSELNGAQQALAMLAKHGPVGLAWSRQIHDGRFARRQPESLNAEEWEFLRGWLRKTGSLRVPSSPP